jgi:UDP-glucuronate 4-epimerase
MIKRNTRVLLTGGAGFIGSHLAEALLRTGAELSVVDNVNDFYSPQWKLGNLSDVRAVGEFRWFESDIRDVDAMHKAFQEVKPECVIHLAGYAGVRPSLLNPRLYETVNVAGTTNLLELSREFGVKTFVFGSSSSVYGATSNAPFRESEVQNRPISPYAATKLAGELLVYTVSHLYALESVCLRLFTVYGPRQRPDLAIHKFTALIEKGKPIPVFGDGSTGRDYTFIDDIVAGVMAAANYKHPAGHVPFDVFNLGNSSPITLAALIEQIEIATGKKAIRDVQPLQIGDMLLTWADTSKSRQLLGYQPMTAIAEGLKKFVAWYRASDPKRRL